MVKTEGTEQVDLSTQLKLTFLFISNWKVFLYEYKIQNYEMNAAAE